MYLLTLGQPRLDVREVVLEMSARDECLVAVDLRFLHAERKAHLVMWSLVRLRARSFLESRRGYTVQCQSLYVNYPLSTKDVNIEIPAGSIETEL